MLLHPAIEFGQSGGIRTRSQYVQDTWFTVNRRSVCLAESTVIETDARNGAIYLAGSPNTLIGLLSINLAALKGFEPSTSAVTGRCSPD